MGNAIDMHEKQRTDIVVRENECTVLLLADCAQPPQEFLVAVDADGAFEIIDLQCRTITGSNEPQSAEMSAGSGAASGSAMSHSSPKTMSYPSGSLTEKSRIP